MSEATTLFPLYIFKPWTGTNLRLFLKLLSSYAIIFTVAVSFVNAYRMYPHLAIQGYLTIKLRTNQLDSKGTVLFHDFYFSSLDPQYITFEDIRTSSNAEIRQASHHNQAQNNILRLHSYTSYLQHINIMTQFLCFMFRNILKQSNLMINFKPFHLSRGLFIQRQKTL